MTVNDLKNGCLFRYRNFNENTLNEILSNVLWHSNNKELNDPFESPFVINKNFVDNDKDLVNAAKVFKIYDGRDEELINVFINDKKSLKKNMKQCFDDIVKVIQLEFNKTLICCFSRDYCSPLMWSHYSDGMRGVCIVYDVDKLQLNKGIKQLVSVNYAEYVKEYKYSDLKIKLDDKDGLHVDLYESGMEDIIYNKHERWSYETEVRSILAPEEHENGASGVSIMMDVPSIKAIIFGNKMSSNNLKLLELVAQSKSIQLFKASPKIQDYSVIIEPYQLSFDSIEK